MPNSVFPKEKGMSEVPKWVYKSSTLHADLQTKLDPSRFHWISPTMACVVGFVLGVQYCLPVIEELAIVYDGSIVARPLNSSKTQIIGKYDDLVSWWKQLLQSAGLSMLELMTAETMFAKKIGYWFEEAN
jgi:hypothetical protein